MLTVTCFLWFDPIGKYNSQIVYGVEHVYRLRDLLARHLAMPHELVCVADRKVTGVRTVEVDRTLIRGGKRWPKLMIYRPDAAEWLGRRILMLDLDCAIVAPLDPLVDRPEDFVAWRNPRPWRKGRCRFNSSMVLLDAGARAQVWRSFDIETSPTICADLYRGGSDQAWLTHCVAHDEAMWGPEDGVYWSRDIEGQPMPGNARIVFYAGWHKPVLSETVPA